MNTRRTGLFFGALGGAVAWSAHLGLAYLVAEFGCLAGMQRYTMMGVTSIAWLVIAVSIVTLAASGAATLVAWRAHRRLGGGTDDDEPSGADAYLAWFGVITSGLFTFVIAVQALPVLFYLSHC